jgi:crossover junction endodeoxyribonuclease RuvC
MIVLGIDPGTANTGYGVVARRDGRLFTVDSGLIATAPAGSIESRLATIHARIGELIDLHQPDAVAIEELYFGRNVRSATAVGQARGAVLAAAGARGVACAGYTPQQIKGAVCGSGAAEKAQVQRMVGTLLALGATPTNHHSADALAVAICHHNHAPRTAALDVAALTAPAAGRRQLRRAVIG